MTEPPKRVEFCAQLVRLGRAILPNSGESLYDSGYRPPLEIGVGHRELAVSGTVRTPAAWVIRSQGPLGAAAQRLNGGRPSLCPVAYLLTGSGGGLKI